jgi:hypothetical protein
MEVAMAAIVGPVAEPGVIAEPRWRGALVAAAVAVLWLVTMEGSAVSQAVGGTASFLHELFHDGRHLLGVPCH